MDRSASSISISDRVVARALTESAQSIAAGRPSRAARDQPVRIQIIAAHLARFGLETVFAKARHCQVVGDDRPDVIVMDAGTSPESVTELCQRETDVPVVVLAPTADPTQLVDALHAGAHGVVVSQVDAERLIEAVEIVAAGAMYVSAEAAAAIAEWFRAGRPPVDAIGRLSDQERRIVELIADGMTNRVIAARLGLSEHTVKTYVSSALHKLGFKNRSQVAAVIAKHRGQLPPA